MTNTHRLFTIPYMAPTSEKVLQYRGRLEGMRNRLLKEIADLQKPEQFGDETADPEDEEADEAEEFGNRLAVAQTKKEELAEVELALSKIQNGTYGICEPCGGQIAKQILDVAPESTRCEACKRTR